MYCVFSGSITFYQYTLESSALTNTLIPRCFTVSNTLSSSLHCIKTTPPKKCYLILTQPHCYTIKLLFLCTNRARFGTHNRFKPPAICKPCTYVNIFRIFYLFLTLCFLRKRTLYCWYCFSLVWFWVFGDKNGYLLNVVICVCVDDGAEPYYPPGLRGSLYVQSVKWCWRSQSQVSSNRDRELLFFREIETILLLAAAKLDWNPFTPFFNIQMVKAGSMKNVVLRGSAVTA